MKLPLRLVPGVLCLGLLWGCDSGGFLSSLGGTSTQDAAGPKTDAGGMKNKADAADAHPKVDAHVADAASHLDATRIDGAITTTADAGPSAPGNTAGALSAGGQLSTSTHYQFVGTLGQTPSGNGVSSAGRLNGGVVAATQQQP